MNEAVEVVGTVPVWLGCKTRAGAQCRRAAEPGRARSQKAQVGGY